MPRCARQKAPNSIYHIMCRSVSEILLFRDNSDKEYYLELLKRYKNKYLCSIYAYCLMDNHLHIHFDCKGYDISKFMQGVNTAYVRYYNKKYKRHGHLFQDRFTSKIITTERYSLAVSAYMHNNAKDIDGYRGKEELYKYSSYGIYLGIQKDVYELIDKSYIMQLFNIKKMKQFIKSYREFVNKQTDIDAKDVLNNINRSQYQNEYRSEKTNILRNYSPDNILLRLAKRFNINADKGLLMQKSNKGIINFRAFFAYIARTLCGLSYRDICNFMNNLTASGCARLCDKGYMLLKGNDVYQKAFDEIIAQSFE